MRPVVIIPAPTDPVAFDLTGWTIGIAGALGAFSVIPVCVWLARVGGFV